MMKRRLARARAHTHTHTHNIYIILYIYIISVYSCLPQGCLWMERYIEILESEEAAPRLVSACLRTSETHALQEAVGDLDTARAPHHA